MNLKITWLIFKNTLNKEWRSKTLFFLLIITILMISLAGATLSFFKENVLTDVPMEGLAQQTLGIFFWIINVWSYLVATFIGVSTVRSDQDGGVMAQMLSFPVARWEYLLGRISGAYFIVTGYYILSLIIGILGISLALGDFVVNAEVFLGAVITSLPNLVVLSLAVFFGLYFKTIQAFIVNFILTFMIGLSNGFFQGRTYGEVLKDMSFLKGAAVVLNTVFPHLSPWESYGKSLILGVNYDLTWSMEIPHFLVTYTLLVGLIVFLFSRKEV